MLKKFFISFLGSFAGICVAGILGVLFLIIFMAAGAISTAGDAQKKVSIKKGSILHIDLSGSIADRQEPVKILDVIYGQQEDVLALNDMIAAINEAATDDRIEGIYLECNGAAAGTAQLNELLNCLLEFKKSGKWIYSYAENYTQGNYYLATAADSIFVNPVGMVDIHGLTGTYMYFKDLLDKVGVKMQIVRVGTYKSAVEPFMLSDMSEASRLQTLAFMDNMWGLMTKTMADNRGVDTTAINRWADNFTFSLSATDYVKEKIVDRTVYTHEMKDILAATTDKDEPNLIEVSDYVTSRVKKNRKGANIAVLYAVGEITESGKDGIASDRLVPQIMKLAKNDDIDALVMRVNSPGGSAFASEQIWEALEQFKEISGKPFYVSMGDYAASGGYYISCGADRIFADPLTLTGSIGIYGMIPDASGLIHDKLGINTSTVATNKGSMPNFFNAMSPELAAAMQGYVNRGYELFTSRCAEGRHMSVDSIKAIAEGRVWDGATALTIGLVDQLGSLDDAIAAVAAKVNEGTDKNGYYVTEYPKVKMEWWEEILQLKSQYSERAIASKLGDAAKYYHTIKHVNEMSPLQCRMDFVEIR